MSWLPPYELYAQKQFRHDLGYALFDPDPCGHYDKVRVGDVGYVSNGKFMRLFNAFHEADSPVNQGVTLPDEFAPIGERFRTLDVSHSLPAGTMSYERVRAFGVEGTVSISGPNNSVRVAKMREMRSGASLLMHYPTNREKAFADMAMEEYLVENYTSWLNMARTQGCSLRPHDLIFVRDCTLTGDWATVVWDEALTVSESGFNIGASSAADSDTSVSVCGALEGQVIAPRLQGPRCTERNRAAYLMYEFDQCVFLKGMRIAMRSWYQELLSIVNTSKATGEGGFEVAASSPSLLHFLRKVGLKVETAGNKSASIRPIQNCYDLMAVFIFENSDADLALIDDRDLYIFDDDQMYSLESMCDCLISMGNFTVDISLSGEERRDKVGRIRWHVIRPSLWNTISSFLMKVSSYYRRMLPLHLWSLLPRSLQKPAPKLRRVICESPENVPLATKPGPFRGVSANLEFEAVSTPA